MELPLGRYQIWALCDGYREKAGYLKVPKGKCFFVLKEVKSSGNFSFNKKQIVCY